MHIAANLHLSSALLFYLAIKEDACGREVCGVEVG